MRGGSLLACGVVLLAACAMTTAHTRGHLAAASWDELGEVGPADTVEAQASPEEQEKAEETADKETALLPQYTEDEKVQIARSQVTPIGKAANGSIETVRDEDKEGEMVDEYQNATVAQAAQKDISRVMGNNASMQFSLTRNKAIKEQMDAQYAARDNLTRTAMNATIEKYIADTNRLRLEHAAACKELLANNPYPINSSQYRAVEVSCLTEDPRNLSNDTVEPAGMRDAHYGPWETLNATDVEAVQTQLSSESAEAPTNSVRLSQSIEDTLDDAELSNGLVLQAHRDLLGTSADNK